MADQTLQVIIEAADQGASAVVSSVLQNILGLDAGTSKMIGTLAQAAGVMIGLTEGFNLLKDAVSETVKINAEWENHLITIANNTNQSTAAIMQMGQAAVNISQQTGASMDDVASGIEHATNVTQDLASATAIAQVATESAVSTGASAADVTNLLANAMHEYGLDVSNAATAQQRMADVQANANQVMGAMHLATAESNSQLGVFTDATAKAVGIAANLGVSMNDVFAATSALTRHGFPDVYQAGTQVTDMLTHMMNPSKQSRDALQELANESGDQGVAHAFDVANLSTRGLVGTLDYLKQAMTEANLTSAEQEQLMNKIIPALRGGLGAAAAIGTAYNDMNVSLQNLNDTQQTNAVTQESINRTLNTTVGQWDVFKANAGALALVIGGPLNTALEQDLVQVNKLIQVYGQAASAVGTAAHGVEGWLNNVHNAMAADIDLNSSLGVFAVVFNGVGSAYDDMVKKQSTYTTETNQAAQATSYLSQSLAMQKDQYAAAKAEMATVATPDDPTAGLKTQLQAVNAELSGNSTLQKEIQAEATQIKDSYEAQLAPLQQQLALENQQYATRQRQLQLEQEGITDSYNAQIQPLQDQLDTLNNQYNTASSKLNVAATQLKDSYDNQLHPLQQQLDTLNTIYDAQKNKLQTAIDGVKDKYDGQLEPLNTQLEHLNETYQLESGPLKEAAESLKASYDAQIQPLQHKLDLENQSYQAASRAIDAQIKAVQTQYTGQIKPLQDELTSVNDQYSAASSALQDRIGRITEAYQNQISPLQQQLDDMKNQVQVSDQELSLQEKLANLAIQQAMLAAEGDPTKRGELAAQLDINKAKEDALKLQEQHDQLTKQLAGGGLTDAQQQDIQLQLQDIAIQQQMNAMVNQQAMDQLITKKDIASAQQQVVDLTQQQYDAQQAMAEIPLEQHVRALEQAEKDALEPLQDQLFNLKEQNTQMVGPLKDAIAALQAQEQAKLDPLQKQKATLDDQHTTMVDSLDGDIQTLTNDEYDRLTPIQNQLNTLQLQHDLATGPLDRAVLKLRDDENDRLQPMQDQLTALDQQHAIQTAPMQTAIKALTTEENNRLYPIQQQLQQLQLQHDIDVGPLNTAVSNLKDQEKKRLEPIQSQLDTLKLQHDTMVNDLQPQIDAITGKENAALQPLNDQLQNLLAQNAQLDIEKQNWDDIIAKMQAAGDIHPDTSHHGTGGGVRGSVSGGGSNPDGHDEVRGAQAFASALGWLGSDGYYINGSTYCEKFVEDITGLGWLGSTAQDAWDNWGNARLPGQLYSGYSLVYFSGPTPAGHVGIADAQGDFVSVLDPPWNITDENVNDFLKDNPDASFLGSVPLYAQGGQMASDGLAYLHAGEFVISQEASRALSRQGKTYQDVEDALGAGGGQITINLTVMGSVKTERDLIEAIHTGLLRKKRSSTSLGLS